MKKTTNLYIVGLVITALLLIGGYIIISFVVKTYTIAREENEFVPLSIVAQNVPLEDISKELMTQWLEGFMKRKYVSAIESYTIHSIELEEIHDSYFIFSSHYSIITDDVDTTWKNWPHTQQGNRFMFERKFRVNRVDDTYHFTTVN